MMTYPPSGNGDEFKLKYENAQNYTEAVNLSDKTHVLSASYFMLADLKTNDGIITGVAKKIKCLAFYKSDHEMWNMSNFFFLQKKRLFMIMLSKDW